MRAFPPFLPPNLPRATAAGFFRFFAPDIGTGSVVDSLTTRNAASLKSSSCLCFAIIQSLHERVSNSRGRNFKLYHYRRVNRYENEVLPAPNG